MGREQGQLIIPKHLLDVEGLDRETQGERRRAERAWYKAHGINPADWSRVVYPILIASYIEHGMYRHLLRFGDLKAAKRRHGWSPELERQWEIVRYINGGPTGPGGSHRG
jgi:hypothetical protein